MKHWKDFLLVGMAAALLYFAFTAVDRNEYAEAKEVELKRQERELRKRDGQIRDLVDSIHKQDLAFVKALQEATKERDRTKADNQKLREQYAKIQRFTTSSDHQRDSLLSAILSH